MNKNLIAFSLLFSCLICIPSCKNSSYKEESKLNIVSYTKTISLEFPEKTAIKISNTSDFPISFILKLNGKPNYNLVELATAIKLMPVEFKGESLERKAWRFVRDNLKFNPAFTEEKWQHNPNLLLNSLGFGQCDDFSSLLVQLWKELGFEARIWGLEGHVVSEVKVNNRWEMYDATYGVYYLNDKKQIASVEELSNQGNLIQNPIEIIPFNNSIDFYSQFARYNTTTAKKYTTKNNNSISDWPTKDILEIDPQINLPAFATLSLPINNAQYPFTILYNSSLPKEEFVQSILVHIPKNKTGKVKLPFVISKIEGKGILEFSDKKINISDLSPNSFKNSFVTELEIITNVSGINIIYYISPMAFKLKEDNELIISTEHPQSIQYSTFKRNKILDVLNSTDSINENSKHKFILPNVSFKVAERNYNHYTLKKQLWVEELQKIKTIEGLYSIVTTFYNTQGQLTINEQAVNSRTINDKIKYLIKSNPKNTELIIQISKRSDLIYLLNILESNEIQELEHFLEILKKQKELKVNEYSL